MAKPIILLCLLSWVMLSACGSSSTPTPVPTPDAAVIRITVARLYKAISDGDNEAYMDVILPANRRVANPINMLQALTIGSTMGLFGISLDMGQLSDVSIRELEVEVVSVAGNYALAKARGTVRYPAMMLEASFCDMHDLRMEEGTWYLDIYAPERQARIDRILEAKQKRLGVAVDAIPTPSSEIDLFSMFSGLGIGLEEALNNCE